MCAVAVTHHVRRVSIQSVAEAVAVEISPQSGPNGLVLLGASIHDSSSKMEEHVEVECRRQVIKSSTKYKANGKLVHRYRAFSSHGDLDPQASMLNVETRERSG